MVKKGESEVNLDDQRLALIMTGQEKFCLVGYNPLQPVES
jgi:hypothetical protein